MSASEAHRISPDCGWTVRFKWHIAAIFRRRQSCWLEPPCASQFQRDFEFFWRNGIWPCGGADILFIQRHIRRPRLGGWILPRRRHLGRRALAGCSGHGNAHVIFGEYGWPGLGSRLSPGRWHMGRWILEGCRTSRNGHDNPFTPLFHVLFRFLVSKGRFGLRQGLLPQRWNIRERTYPQKIETKKGGVIPRPGPSPLRCTPWRESCFRLAANLFPAMRAIRDCLSFLPGNAFGRHSLNQS